MTDFLAFPDHLETTSKSYYALIIYLSINAIITSFSLYISPTELTVTMLVN